MPILKKYHVLVMSDNVLEAKINVDPSYLLTGFEKVFDHVVDVTEHAAEKLEVKTKELIEASDPQNIVGVLTDKETSEKFKTITTKLKGLEDKLNKLSINPAGEEYQKLKLEIEDMQKKISEELTGIGQKFAISLIPEVGPGLSAGIANIKSSINSTYETLNKMSVFNDEKTEPVKEEKPGPVKEVKGGYRHSNIKNKTQKRRLSIKIKKLKDKINRTIKLFQRTNIIV